MRAVFSTHPYQKAHHETNVIRIERARRVDILSIVSTYAAHIRQGYAMAALICSEFYWAMRPHAIRGCICCAVSIKKYID